MNIAACNQRQNIPVEYFRFHNKECKVLGQMVIYIIFDIRSTYGNITKKAQLLLHVFGPKLMAYCYS